MKDSEAINRLWQRVRRKHLFPEIPRPKVGETESHVAMEMKNKQITVDGDFLKRVGETMGKEDALEALLDHGVGHHAYCPWDFKTHLAIYSEAKKVVGDKTMAKRGAGCFMDVVVDTNCVKREETKLPDLYRAMERGPVEEVLASLYERIWGVDLESRGESNMVRRLSRISYLDRRRWPQSVHRFTRIIKALLEEERQQSEGKGDQKENMMGNHDLSSFSPEEVDQGLKDFARESKGLKEFREIIEDFEGELKDLGYGAEGDGPWKRGHDRRRRPLLYEAGGKLFDADPKNAPREKGVHASSLSPSLGGWETCSGHRCMDELREDYAGDHSDLEKALGENLRRSREHT